MLKRYESKAKFQIAEAIADTADVGGAKHATYFCLQTKSRARSQYTRPAAPHHLHDVELAPDGGTLLDDSAHIRRRSFSHSDITRLSPPRPTAAERASSDGAAMRGSKSSGQLTRV